MFFAFYVLLPAQVPVTFLPKADIIKLYSNIVVCNAVYDEKKAEIQQNMNAMEDAQTGGLSVYTRRADESEDKAWNK